MLDTTMKARPLSCPDLKQDEHESHNHSKMTHSIVRFVSLSKIVGGSSLI